MQKSIEKEFDKRFIRDDEGHLYELLLGKEMKSFISTHYIFKQNLKEAIEKKMIGIQRDSRLFYELDTLKDELLH